MTIGRPQIRIFVLVTVPIDEEAKFRTSGPKGKMCAAEWHGSACNGLDAAADAWIRQIERGVFCAESCAVLG